MHLKCSIPSSFKAPSAPKEPLLLDLFPDALTAYSLSRKLRTDYLGNALKVVNENLIPLDVGYDSNNNVDEGSLHAHRTGTGILKLETLYDNSLSNKNWTQTDTNKQLIIADSSGLIKLNGRLAASSVDNRNAVMLVTSQGTSEVTAFHVLQSQQQYTMINSPFPYTWYGSSLPHDGNCFGNMPTPSLYINSVNKAPTHRNIYDSISTQSVLTFIMNLSNINWTGYTTGDPASNTWDTPEYIQETIMYSNHTVDRLAVETNIKNYYSIA